MREVRLNG